MGPADKPEVVKSFDASRLEFPEGITIDKAGNIYVSLGPPFWLPDVDYFGEIWKISPDGTEMVLAEIDGPPAAGLTVDASGNVYYAYPTSDENTRGVYRLTEDGSTERLPGTENIILANGVAFDKQGNLYVSDSILGAIWRIPSGEAAVAENWFQHEWLGGCEEDPFGANGVAYWKGNLYVASTTKGLLVRIPLLEDGSAGEPEIVAGEDDCDPEFDELDAMDGIALDVDGNVYALLVLQHKLVRIDPTDGTSATLLTDADGLHNPASIAFGTGKDNQESVFFTNFAVLPPEPPASFGPAVPKFDVGVPGLPLP
jgi:sugar lactone lactonase YvrE